METKFAVTEHTLEAERRHRQCVKSVSAFEVRRGLALFPAGGLGAQSRIVRALSGSAEASAVARFYSLRPSSPAAAAPAPGIFISKTESMTA